ncbi:Thymidylate synthase [Bienertia sinuspersici]
MGNEEHGKLCKNTEVGVWNKGRKGTIYFDTGGHLGGEGTTQRILSTYLPKEEKEDEIIWLQEENGDYSVKSGYWNNVIFRKVSINPHGIINVANTELDKWYKGFGSEGQKDKMQEMGKGKDPCTGSERPVDGFSIENTMQGSRKIFALSPLQAEAQSLLAGVTIAKAEVDVIQISTDSERLIQILWNPKSAPVDCLRMSVLISATGGLKNVVAAAVVQGVTGVRAQIYGHVLNQTAQKSAHNVTERGFLCFDNDSKLRQPQS